MRESTQLRKVKIKMNHTKTWVPSGDSDGLVGSVLLQTPVVIMFLEAFALLDL